MSLEEITLIDIVEKFPHLWDKKDAYNKDKIAIENSWKTISQVMALSVDDCQEMWKSIRLKFIRERRQLKNVPSGSGAYSCNWPLYEKLGFLHDNKGKHFEKKNETNLSTPSEIWDDIIMLDGEVSSQEIGETDNEVIQETESETERSPAMCRVQKRNLCNITNILSTHTNTPSSYTNTTVNNDIHKLRQEKLLKKRKFDVPLEQLVETCSSVGKSLHSFLNNSPMESNIAKDDYHFGLSIAESIGKMRDEKKKLKIKAEMFVIADAMD